MEMRFSIISFIRSIIIITKKNANLPYIVRPLQLTPWYIIAYSMSACFVTDGTHSSTRRSAADAAGDNKFVPHPPALKQLELGVCLASQATTVPTPRPSPHRAEHRNGDLYLLHWSNFENEIVWSFIDFGKNCSLIYFRLYYILNWRSSIDHVSVKGRRGLRKTPRNETRRVLDWDITCIYFPLSAAIFKPKKN